jgi:hypothetical protein
MSANNQNGKEMSRVSIHKLPRRGLLGNSLACRGTKTEKEGQGIGTHSLALPFPTRALMSPIDKQMSVPGGTKCLAVQTPVDTSATITLVASCWARAFSTCSKQPTTRRYFSGPPCSFLINPLLQGRPVLLLSPETAPIHPPSERRSSRKPVISSS